MIKVQIYYYTYSWENDSPEEVLSLLRSKVADTSTTENKTEDNK